MAQVKFLQGTQQSLNTLLSRQGTAGSYSQGAFYLTTDTDRLYFAQSDSELVPLNQFIRTVATQADMPANPEDGDYVYVKADNILAVYEKNGNEGGWIHLNPDTNDTLVTTTSGIAAGSVTGNDNAANINLSIFDTASHHASGTVTLEGGSNVSVTRDGNTITIDTANDVDTNYSIGTDAATGLSQSETGAKIVLDSTKDNDDSNITIKSNNGNLSVSEDNGVITLSAADQSVNDVTTTFDANGVFKVGVMDATDASHVLSSGITPKVTYGATGETSDAVFSSGTATLDVYTTGQVDSKISRALSAADAMTYMGTVDSTNAVTKLVTTASWGSVYKVSSDISNPVNAKTGDLVIAQKADGFTGTEGQTNGTEWVVVPSGDDQTITFTANETTGQVSASDGTNGAGIKVAGGTHVNVTHSKSGNIITSTVAQAADYTAQNVTGSTADQTLSAANSTATTQTFEAITGIQTDAYGNVVDGSIAKHTLTVTDSHANINSVSNQVTSASNVATVKTFVQDSDNVTKNSTLTVSSDNLTVTNGQSNQASASTSLKINLEWGTF